MAREGDAKRWKKPMVVAWLAVVFGLWAAVWPERIAMMITNDVIPSGDLLDAVSTYGWWTVAAGLAAWIMVGVIQWYNDPKG